VLLSTRLLALMQVSVPLRHCAILLRIEISVTRQAPFI
jgi:hypothetical protein